MNRYLSPYCRLLAAALLPLLAACSLTAEEVEPALPSGPVNGSNTLAYYANGRPTVANNSNNLGTILAGIFGGDTRAVVGQLRSGGVSLRATDYVTARDAGVSYHVLYLAINSFHGPGTYPLTRGGTSYQESSAQNTSPTAPAAPTYYPAPPGPSQVVVTGWDAATRHLQGTFALTAAAPGVAAPVALTDGRFDLILDQ